MYLLGLLFHVWEHIYTHSQIDSLYTFSSLDDPGGLRDRHRTCLPISMNT